MSAWSRATTRPAQEFPLQSFFIGTPDKLKGFFVMDQQDWNKE